MAWYIWKFFCHVCDKTFEDNDFSEHNKHGKVDRYCFSSKKPVSDPGLPVHPYLRQDGTVSDTDIPF